MKDVKRLDVREMPRSDAVLGLKLRMSRRRLKSKYGMDIVEKVNGFERLRSKDGLQSQKEFFWVDSE